MENKVYAPFNDLMFLLNKVRAAGRKVDDQIAKIKKLEDADPEAYVAELFKQERETDHITFGKEIDIIQKHKGKRVYCYYHKSEARFRFFPKSYNTNSGWVFCGTFAPRPEPVKIDVDYLGADTAMTHLIKQQEKKLAELKQALIEVTATVPADVMKYHDGLGDAAESKVAV